MILCINTSPKSIRMVSEFIKAKSRSQQEKAFFPYIPHGFPLVGRHSVGSFVSEEVLREVSLWYMAPCGVFFVESRTEKWPARSDPARQSPQWTTAHCRTLCFWSLLPSFLQELSTLGLKNTGQEKDSFCKWSHDSRCCYWRVKETHVLVSNYTWARVLVCGAAKIVLQVTNTLQLCRQ